MGLGPARGVDRRPSSILMLCPTAVLGSSARARGRSEASLSAPSARLQAHRAPGGGRIRPGPARAALCQL